VSVQLGATKVGTRGHNRPRTAPDVNADPASVSVDYIQPLGKNVPGYSESVKPTATRIALLEKTWCRDMSDDDLGRGAVAIYETAAG
jgi:hypothetical protein